MLKIKLENDDAELLVNQIKQLIKHDRPFAVFEIDPNHGQSLANDLDKRQIDFWKVTGQNTWDEPFSGVIIATDTKQAITWPEEVEQLADYRLEKPYIYLSRAEVEKIWPHETLEDRVTDLCLAALSGYAVPKLANII